MKRNLAKKITLALAVGMFIVSSNAAVTYASAEGNTVTIENDIVADEDEFYGGYSGGISNANSNIVTVKNSEFDVYPALVGGYSYDGAAEDNIVTITESIFNDSAAVFGGQAGGDTTGNAVTITDSVFSGIAVIHGGLSNYIGDAVGNTVAITDSTFNGGDGIFGGANYSSGTANDNTVNITNGTFGNSTQISGGYSMSNEANNNTVNITGGTFGTGSIVVGGFSAYGSADGNTVTISGTADMSNVFLIGGRVGASDMGSDNTLNIGSGAEGWQNHDIQTIWGFDRIEFNNLMWENGATAVQTDNLTMSTNGVTVKVNSIAEGSKPKKNDTMTLIAAENDFDESLIKGTGEIAITSFVEAEGEISAENNKINLTITKAGGNEQALLIGESRTAATAFVNQGIELVEVGLDALHRDVTANETKVFAALYNNASKFETGSHIKVNGWSGIVGVGKTNDDGLTYGAFFESGEGNYRTYNYMDGVLMRGDGEANYNGGGLLIRKDHKKGFYAEASLRAGNLSNRLDDAVMGSEGLTGYDIDTFYYGAHIGIGKIIPKGEDSLDIYGKFLYTHHDSETFEVDGDEFQFDSMDSQRLRLGFRYNQAQTDKLGLYYGAAYEYEFGGEADNTVVGYDLSTPSLEGSTVIGELGMHYLVNPRWSLDANLRGYTGQRDGWSGSVQVNYSF